jgi:ATP-binding cassette subfamily F protein uup
LLPAPAKKDKPAPEKQAAKQPEIRSETAPKKKAGFKEKFEHEQLEKEIPLLESRKKQLENSLSGTLPYDEIARISKELESLTHELEDKSLRWLELSELL